MDFVTEEQLAASAYETSLGFLVIVSKTNRDAIDLLLIEHVHPRKAILGYLRDEMARVKNFIPMDALALRENMSPQWAPLLSRHLHELHKLAVKEDDVIVLTAKFYKDLISWGEASAARELALEMKVSVHTIHSRLRIARSRGILRSPGSGSRLGV